MEEVNDPMIMVDNATIPDVASGTTTITPTLNHTSVNTTNNDISSSSSSHVMKQHDKENLNHPNNAATTHKISSNQQNTSSIHHTMTSTTYHIPWVEKFRPKTLQDVLGNTETIIRLRAIAKDGNMPNLILCGPPGTGKTTSVHALARELLGSYYSKDSVLELNASDARGIDVVRNQIKSFAMNKCTLPPGRHKIIILDEADSMTSAAQQALRRTMELYSHTTRFCLACNISTKIIEAIQSRAAILRYSRLSNDQILDCILHVCQKEEVPYTMDGLEAILFTAEGDMRHALNTLQASYYLIKQSTAGTVNQTTVFKVCDQPHPKILHDIIDACMIGNTKDATQQMYQLYQSGYSASDIIGTIFKVVKSHTTIPEGMKLEYLREIGFTHIRISDGVNTVLQLLGLISRLSQMCPKN